VAETPTVRRFTARDGVRLVADEYGTEGAHPVLFLHGGGQTRHSWGAAARSLAKAGFHVLSLDLRGHGDSDWSPAGRYGGDAFVEDLEDVLDALGGRAALIGASLGGLVSLRVAARYGDRISKLVLVDVVPRIEAEGAAEITGFMRAHLNGFGSLDEAADAVAAYLPHRRRRSSHAGLMKNLRERDGRFFWHWDPRMLRDRGADDRATDASLLEDAARAVVTQTLLIRGGMSRIVSVEGVDEFRRLIPHAEAVTVERADHMVAGDDNDAFNAPLIAFMTGKVAR
jgi:pimeloyl-ACP methyl ester carboxylesterase